MTKPNPTVSNRLEREAHLRWVPIGKMKVSTLAQRDFNLARVDRIAQTMDLEQLGNPTVNERDGAYFVIDGQHRVEAYKEWIGEGWPTQQLQCWCYIGLSEEDEAEKFLKLNDVLTVDAMSKFKVGVQAGRPVESDIDRIVRAQGLCVTRGKIEGGIRAVGALRRVYERDGAAACSRALGLIRDAYGTAGFESAVIDGLGLVCGRYNGSLNIPAAVMRLGNAHGGVHGLLNKARDTRNQTGNPLAHCIAAAAVDLINRGAKRTEKLPSWWKPEAA